MYISVRLRSYNKHSRIEMLNEQSQFEPGAPTMHGHVESRCELKTRVKVKAVDWRVPVSNEVRPRNQSNTHTYVLSSLVFLLFLLSLSVCLYLYLSINIFSVFLSLSVPLSRSVPLSLCPFFFQVLTTSKV